MHLSLAGWRIELRVSPPALAGLVAARYAGFIVPPGGETDLVVEVECEPWSGVSLEAPGSIVDALLASRGEEFLLDGPAFYGIIAVSRGSASLRLSSDEPAREVEYFLRIALALFAFKRDGLLLHCAALARTASASEGEFRSNGGAGRVHLFVGQSGSGKSTVVALSQAAGRALALGDDLILLRREARGWCAYGTPFWNFATTHREGETESGPVARIFKLVQDCVVSVEPMGRAAATAELLANCPIVNDQPALLLELIVRCRDIAQAIGVERLHFRKDDAFWDVIAQEAL